MYNNLSNENNNLITPIDKFEQNPKYNLLHKIILFTEFILIFACLSVSIIFFVQRFFLNTSYKYLILFFLGTLIFTILIGQILVYKLKRINKNIPLLDSLVIIITLQFFVYYNFIIYVLFYK